MDASDGLILIGSGVVGANGNPFVVFTGGLIASIGINIQFETTRLSITRIVALSLAGYVLGSYWAEKKK